MILRGDRLDTLLGLVGFAAFLVGLNEPMPPERGCPDQRACIAMAAYTEARGEGLLGMLAVAEVVVARGGEPCETVSAQDQFHGVRDVLRPFEPWKTDPANWGKALLAARLAQEGEVRTRCAGNTHFFAHQITQTTPTVQGLAGRCVIGGHTFYTTE